MRVDKVRKVIEPPENRENDDNGKVITAGNREKSCGKSHVRKVIWGKSCGKDHVGKSYGESHMGKVVWEKTCGKSHMGKVMWEKSCGKSHAGKVMRMKARVVKSPRGSHDLHGDDQPDHENALIYSVSAHPNCDVGKAAGKVMGESNLGKVMREKSCGKGHAGKVIWEKSCGKSHAGKVIWEKSCGKGHVGKVIREKS